MKPTQLLWKVLLVTTLLLHNRCSTEREWIGQTFVGPNGLAEVSIFSDSLLVISRIEKLPDTLSWVFIHPYIYTSADTIELLGNSLVLDGHIFSPPFSGRDLKVMPGDLVNHKFSYSASSGETDCYLFMDDYLMSYNQSLNSTDLRWKLIDFKGRQYLKLPTPKNWEQYHYVRHRDETGYELVRYNADNFSYNSVKMLSLN